MAPNKRPRKRSTTSTTAASSLRDVRSRIDCSSTRTSRIRSGSRYREASYRSSSGLQHGPGDNQDPAASERAQSIIATSAFTEDARSVAPTEAHLPDDTLEGDMDALAEIIMAVNMTDRGSIGCAYYVAREEKLYFMEDVPLGNPNMVDTCKYVA